MSANQAMLVIGLMSGTSVDGIDAALVRTDGVQLERLAAVSHAYRASTRKTIFAVYENPSVFLANKSAVQALSVAIAQDHADAVAILKQHTDEPVQLIGFHGQTVLHQPGRGVTVQLGDAAVLAQLTQINIVHDFRSADMQAGGQGAPLAPIYHRHLMQGADVALPAVMLNIGGVANLTYWDGENLAGFDTGPGNGLLDQYMQQHLGCAYDAGGALAASGQADQNIVNDFLHNAFFDHVAPKSLDRADFNRLLQSESLARLSHADAMATLTTLTVSSIQKTIEQFEHRPKQIIVCGGGQHNSTMIGMLQQVLDGVVSTANSLALPGDFIEAELMGFLAARFYYKLPATFPHTTGASHPCVAGVMQKAIFNT